MDAQQITEAFNDIFDQGIVFHGFTDYMRDYDVIVYVGSDPRTGIEPEHVRYRFKHCVEASVTSAVSPTAWSESLDERLVDGWQDQDLDGYVWGVRWQVLCPGAKLLPESKSGSMWTARLGMSFHEALIEANGHNISLVFSDLVVDRVVPGYAPFTVTSDG